MNKLGYVVLATALSAQRYGVPQSRDRWWVLGFLVSESPVQQTAEAFVMPPFVNEIKSLLQELELPDMIPLPSFLHDNGGECPWKEEFEQKDGEAAPPNKKSKETYMVDNLQAFETNGIEWPPKYTAEFLSYTRHLSDRKRQSIWFWEKVYDRVGDDEVEDKDAELTVDSNMSCVWQYVRPNMAPCIVSSSRIWLLKAKRLVSGEEALELQGFPAEQQRLADMDPPLSCRDVVDLAGNAFNGPVAMAVLISIFVACDWRAVLDMMEKFAKAKSERENMVAGSAVCEDDDDGTDGESLGQDGQGQQGESEDPLTESDGSVFDV